MARVRGEQALHQRGARAHHAYHYQRRINALVINMRMPRAPKLHAQTIHQTVHHAGAHYLHTQGIERGRLQCLQ